MSWSLNAAGHVPVPAQSDAPDAPPATTAMAVEAELYEALKAVLSDPRYGTATSSFGGSHVSGSLHVADG
jgi:hypothetical protein